MPVAGAERRRILQAPVLQGPATFAWRPRRLHRGQPIIAAHHRWEIPPPPPGPRATSPDPMLRASPPPAQPPPLVTPPENGEHAVGEIFRPVNIHKVVGEGSLQLLVFGISWVLRADWKMKPPHFSMRPPLACGQCKKEVAIDSCNCHPITR